MYKHLSLFLTVIGLSFSNFQAFSSTPLNDEFTESTLSVPSSAVGNIKYCLGTALLLAAQLPAVAAKQALPELDDSANTTNNTCQPCVCPTSSSANPGDFFVNNLAIITTAATLSVILAPKVNQWILDPAFQYVWNRYLQTTIDDIPLGDKPEDVNLLKRFTRKAYNICFSDTYYSVFQPRLRDYKAVGLKSKIYEEIKLIDYQLSKKLTGWSKTPIYKDEKIMKVTFKRLNGFSYENGVISIALYRMTQRQYSTDAQLPAPLETHLRASEWISFTNFFNPESNTRHISALPEKVYNALTRLALNIESNENTLIKNNNEFIIYYDVGLCISLKNNMVNLN